MLLAFFFLVLINTCRAMFLVLVPVLLEALQDPSQKTIVALRKLVDTKFVHVIDAPSLALVMPVVQRAFQDRTAETRKVAAQIIRNMYSLTNEKVSLLVVSLFCWYAVKQPYISNSA